MSNILTSLIRIIICVLLAIPIAVVADVITLGGVLNGNDEPYTSKALLALMKNIENASRPEA